MWHLIQKNTLICGRSEDLQTVASQELKKLNGIGKKICRIDEL